MNMYDMIIKEEREKDEKFEMTFSEMINHLREINICSCCLIQESCDKTHNCGIETITNFLKKEIM